MRGDFSSFEILTEAGGQRRDATCVYTPPAYTCPCTYPLVVRVWRGCMRVFVCGCDVLLCLLLRCRCQREVIKIVTRSVLKNPCRLSFYSERGKFEKYHDKGPVLKRCVRFLLVCTINFIVFTNFFNFIFHFESV